MSELGYTSVTFNQSFHSKDRIRYEPHLLPTLIRGLRHIWTQELHDVLDSIEGDKVIFSFSLPSSAALKAIGQRRAKDITAWICDGGPFLHIHRCYWNYFTHQQRLSNLIQREAAVLGSYLLFGAFGFY